jgi:hypothetical protein
MPIKTRIDPIRETLTLMVKESLSPEARSKALAEYAAVKIAEVDQANDQSAGRDVPYKTFVDGVESSALQSVRPNGVITAVWDIESASYVEIVKLLRDNSPIRSGRFRNTIVFLADGIEADPANPPIADEYVIISPQPYARKIERGLSKQAPADPYGVFESVAQIAQRRFGNIARVRFGYRSLVGGPVGDWAAKTNMAGGPRGANKRQDWLTRQPAIVITPYTR